MTTLSSIRRGFLALALAALPANAQSWRQTAATLGSTARVLIVGTRPEDEDNALIAWLSLGRNVETAYLSLTRGESGINIAGGERQAYLGVVRTAELLAERKRDGARQYFTRAYDFGSTTKDSIVDAAWPRDSLMIDVVSIVRAFRPQVIISLFSDSTDRDATHRVAAKLARAAFAAAGGGGKYPLSPWTVSRFFTRVDSGPADVSIDVGEFDRASGKSFAELGAEIRRLQRTQPPLPAPSIGRQIRHLRLDASNVEHTSGLFDGIDTTWKRFQSIRLAETRPLLDSLLATLDSARALARTGSPDSLAAALARVVKRSLDVRTSYGCSEYSGVPGCSGTLADLSLAVTRLREQATRALLGAAGISVDGTAGRELVAVGDSVPLEVTIYNGGGVPLTVKRLAASTRGVSTRLVDSTSQVTVRPDSVARWSSSLRVMATSLYWWQVRGLQAGTALHDISTPRGRYVGELIAGEDRVEDGGVEVTLTLGGIDVPIIERPIYVRGETGLRGDTRHTVKGTTRLSLLLEHAGEYERAKQPIDRIFRVYVSTTKVTPETALVTLHLPKGLRADTATRRVILPPLGARNVFFRLRGSMPPGRDTIAATAQSGNPSPPKTVGGVQSVRPASLFGAHNYGIIPRDYPHIPSQLFIRQSKLRVEAVDLRVPPKLRVAYVKGTEDIQTWLGELQINLQTLEPSLLSVVDLSVFSTVLIGADALANDALSGAVESLREFVRNGGAVVILAGGREVANSGLLPFPITIDSVPFRMGDPEAPLVAPDKKSQLLSWPNALGAVDFNGWTTERARGIPSAVDSRYRTVFVTGEAGQPAGFPALVSANVGKGVVVYSPLSVDRELAAIHPGAARIFVNLLSAGLKPAR